MIYVMSDIHGRYDKYLKMLEIIKFNDNDTLYILGDFVDRGKDGIRLLLDIMARSNVIPLIGNHDWTFFVLVGYYKELMKIGEEKIKELYRLWFSDGGKPTYDEFKKLDKDTKIKILQYIKRMQYNVEIKLSNKKYFMAHTVPEFDGLDLSKHPKDDFIHGEPDYDKRYSLDMTIITGHTPTGLIDEEYSGRIWQGNGHIALDCGAGFDGNLGCLCLDTMEEYYV